MAGTDDAVLSAELTVAEPERHRSVVDFLDCTEAPPLALRASASAVLVVVVLAVENRVAERRPALAETSLEVPGLQSTRDQRSPSTCPGCRS